MHVSANATISDFIFYIGLKYYFEINFAHFLFVFNLKLN